MKKILLPLSVATLFSSMASQADVCSGEWMKGCLAAAEYEYRNGLSAGDPDLYDDLIQMCYDRTEHC